MFDDHLPCPALARWLVPTWQGRAVAVYTDASESRWRPPRGLRRLVKSAGAEPLSPTPTPGGLDVLVVLAPLSDRAPGLDDAGWQALRPGGQLVELAVPRARRPAEWIRPWAHTERMRDAAVMRLRHWLDRGAFAPEQWVPLEPPGVLLTMVQRAVAPASP